MSQVDELMTSQDLSYFSSHTPVLEFIYAQSPESMKGLLTGLYFLIYGLTSIPSSALYYLYTTNTQQNRELLPFYGVFTVLMVYTAVRDSGIFESVCVCVCMCVCAGGGYSVLCGGCSSAQQQTEAQRGQSTAETHHREPAQQHCHSLTHPPELQDFTG